MKLKKILLSSLCVLSLALCSCHKKEVEPSGDDPTVPPVQDMEPDVNENNGNTDTPSGDINTPTDPVVPSEPSNPDTEPDTQPDNPVNPDTPNVDENPSDDTPDEIDYDDFSNYMLTSKNEILSKDLTNYYVYFYRTNCDACNELKPTLLDKTETYNEASRNKIYFADMSNTAFSSIASTRELETIVNVSNVDRLKLGAIPTIIKITNKKVVAYWQGTYDIEDFLNDELLSGKIPDTTTETLERTNLTMDSNNTNLRVETSKRLFGSSGGTYWQNMNVNYNNSFIIYGENFNFRINLDKTLQATSDANTLTILDNHFTFSESGTYSDIILPDIELNVGSKSIDTTYASITSTIEGAYSLRGEMDYSSYSSDLTNPYTNDGLNYFGNYSGETSFVQTVNCQVVDDLFTLNFKIYESTATGEMTIEYDFTYREDYNIVSGSGTNTFNYAKSSYDRVYYDFDNRILSSNMIFMGNDNN